MQAHISRCQPILHAQKVFATQMCYSLALAVSKGHLLSNHFLGTGPCYSMQQCCQDTTVSWHFSAEDLLEHSFVSLLWRISQAAVELKRGPMAASMFITRESIQVFPCSDLSAHVVWPYLCQRLH